MNDLDRHSHLNRDIKSHTPNPNPTLHGVTKYEKKYDQNTSCNCKGPSLQLESPGPGGKTMGSD